MAGHGPLEAGILVQIQVPQQSWPLNVAEVS